MRWIALLAAAGALAAAVAGPGRTASTPPLVPPFVQGLVLVRAGTLAYVPTSAPFAYRYLRFGWDAGRQTLAVRLADHRFRPDGRHSIVFEVAPFAGPASACADGKVKTMQLRGNKVFWDGSTAWRCVRTPAGRLVREAATGPGLPDSALGRVVASAKRLG